MGALEDRLRQSKAATSKSVEQDRAQQEKELHAQIVAAIAATHRLLERYDWPVETPSNRQLADSLPSISWGIVKLKGDDYAYCVVYLDENYGLEQYGEYIILRGGSLGHKGQNSDALWKIFDIRTTCYTSWKGNQSFNAKEFLTGIEKLQNAIKVRGAAMR